MAKESNWRWNVGMELGQGTGATLCARVVGIPGWFLTNDEVSPGIHWIYFVNGPDPDRYWDRFTSADPHGPRPFPYGVHVELD